MTTQKVAAAKEADELLIETMCKVADAIGKTFGPTCEVAVHDLRKPTRSLVYLAHGQVTGRRLGSPIRDLIHRVLPEMDHKQGGLFNYLTVLGDGRRLKSSTCLIRNSSGEPLIAFCINLDITALESAMNVLREFGLSESSPTSAEQSDDECDGGVVAKAWSAETFDVLRQLIANIVRPMGRDIASLSKAEKLTIIEFLEQKGAFRLKGAVDILVDALQTSKPTIYRYIAAVRGASGLRKGAG